MWVLLGVGRDCEGENILEFQASTLWGLEVAKWKTNAVSAVKKKDADADWSTRGAALKKDEDLDNNLIIHCANASVSYHGPCCVAGHGKNRRQSMLF